MMRVHLPYHLRSLARVDAEVPLAATTIREVLDGLESTYPALRGTLRDPASGQRRAYVRFFACQQDLSHGSLDDPLPEDVLSGKEPFLVVGAMSGG